MMKKIIGLVLSFIIAAGLIPLPVFANGVDVFIDGVPVQFNDSTGRPFISGGRTLVPLRATMESFGATVSWDQDSKTAFVRKGSTTVKCTIGENSVYRNNVEITNDAAAVISGGRTYLPIRAVLESFGAIVSWDGAVRVTSSVSGALIYTVEHTPAVTNNYWGIWNDALSMKNSGNYQGAIDTILSISSAFLSENPGASSAMLFKHLGECYSNLKDYESAAQCFKREAFYWSQTPGMEESRIDAERRSRLIATSTQIFIKNTDLSMSARKYFGVEHEPEGKVYIGAYAEGDTNIYNPYSPDKFYMDTYPQLIEHTVAAYLLYLPYGTGIEHYSSHIARAIEKNKILQIALEPHQGLHMVNNTDGYLIKLATDMENSGCKLMLRFAGEMNDTTSEWFSTDTETYKNKFRMVSDIFHQYAPSVPVIWAPNFYPSDTINSYYPGDQYVDYVGISSYSMHQPITDPLGQGIDRSRWSNQLDTLYSLYGHKKPIIIVEGGASYMDYDTYQDVTDFATNQIKDFYTYLPIKYPNVKMAFEFDSDRDRQKFSLSNNHQYLLGYEEGIASSMYSGDLDNSGFQFDYYELGNNVNIKAEPTELCSYIATPENDTAYVIYSINGVYLGTTYGIPHSIKADFSGFKGQKINITAESYNSNNQRVTSYTVTVNVI